MMRVSTYWWARGKDTGASGVKGVGGHVEGWVFVESSTF